MEGSIMPMEVGSEAPMWADEFRAVLEEIGGARRAGGALGKVEGAISWSFRGLAERVGESEVEVRQWDAGVKPVRKDVAAWLRRRVEARRGLPPPDLAGVRAGRLVLDGMREPRERYRKNREGGEDSDERAAARETWRRALKDETESRARRLRAGMAQLGWSLDSLAGKVGRARTVLRYWMLGHGPAPLELVEWVEAVAESDAADPPPAKVLPGGVRAADMVRMRGILGAEARRMREVGDIEAASSVERGALLLDRLPGLIGPRVARGEAPERPRPVEAAPEVARGVYPEGEPMGPEELREVRRDLALGENAAVRLLDILEQAVASDEGEGRDVLAWFGVTQGRIEEARNSLVMDRQALANLLDWPGLDARKLQRMESPASGMAVPGPVAGWLRAAVAEMREGRPIQAWAILKRPPPIPPKSGWTWMQKRQGQAERRVVEEGEPEQEAAHDPVRELLGDDY